MKRNRFSIVLPVMLAIVLALGLAACEKDEAPAPPDPGDEIFMFDGDGMAMPVPEDEGSAEEPEPEVVYLDEEEMVSLMRNDESLIALQERIRNEGCAMGVAYLGIHQGGFNLVEDFLVETGYAEAYPFLNYMTEGLYVDCKSGYEAYLIVPAQPSDIIVESWFVDESNNYTGGIHEDEPLLYMSAAGSRDGSEPFIMLYANVSEIAPSSVITLKKFGDDSGTELVYNPQLSMMDGSLYIPAHAQPGYGILDITLPGATDPIALG